MYYPTNIDIALETVKEVTSTNDYLSQLCKEGKAKEFYTLIAEYQTDGKGQRGNTWVSLLLQRSCFRPNVRLNTERMQLADSVILSAIDNGDMPGAVLCVVSRARDGESMGHTLYLKAFHLSFHL